MMLDTLEKALQDGRAPWTNVYLDTRDFTVFEDAYPVTEGHLLIVPKVNDQDSAEKCFRFATAMGTQNVDTANNNITGYNIGLNIGTTF